MAWHGTVQLGMARQGKIRHGFIFMDDEFYTVKEFAALLKMSPETIRRAIRKGEIVAVKLIPHKNSSYRISRYQLDRMAQNINSKGKNNEDSYFQD